uniref:BHLH domain-containing protein n=3 Tax=Daucus carota subsp. sativus TaxID=79200 RepID=A0A162AE00_DAUCS
MVCQAAGQTKFRALKHENGIAGGATIIVRVIACFQPLQDCQAEYFRQLLKPVTTVNSCQYSSVVNLRAYSFNFLSGGFGWMEEGIGSWYGHQQSNGQSPNLNILNAQYGLGQQTTVPSYINLCSNFTSTTGVLPMHGFYGMPQVKDSQPNEPRGWFYCLPRFRQAFTPVLNSASPYKNCGDSVPFDTQSPPKMSLDTQSASKRFLVFDQSGDQTTLIFGSGINSPVSNMPSLRPKPSNAFTLYKEELESKRDASNPSMQFSPKRYVDQDYETDVKSEMHEDSEELDALLYSDDEDDYSEDEEEASTGHSPDTTPFGKRVWSDESGEEVASSAMPTKKQKLSGEGHNVPSLVDTASSFKSDKCIEYEHDAESNCGNSNNMLGESDSVSHQQSKIDKIRKTISILESIIPDGKGKDSIAVIDDAIHYLRSLKDKARVLGLDGQ